MSTLSQFAGGNVPPKALINGVSTSGWGCTTLSGTTYIKEVLSGALTAATLKTILSITGGGVLEFIQTRQVDTTSRTHRMRITIDGTVVLDSTSSACVTSNNGGTFITSPIPFSASLLVEIASSLTETDKIATGLKYRTN